MSATIADIADQLKVSRMTVSKALRGVGSLRPETREAVLAAARAMGYRPNTSARAMKTRRFSAIALILSAMADGRSRITNELLHGINLAVNHRRIHLSLAELADTTFTDADGIPAVVRELSVDGFLMNYTHNVPAQLSDLLARHKVPVIWINRKLPTSCVHPDDAAAGAACVQQLLQLGHRRIAYVAFGAAIHYSRADRLEGYRNAMRDAGLPPLVLETEQNDSAPDQAIAARESALRRILEQRNRPTALVTYDTPEAAAAYITALRLGLSIPRDLSIISMGVRPIDLGSVVVTSFMAPMETIGSQAVDLLYTLMAKPAEPLPTVAVPFTFVPGHTCDRAPSLSNTKSEARRP